MIAGMISYVEKQPQILLKLAFGQALVGLLASLYFSEIATLPPCTLCWWQRIAMYPLVWILWVGIKHKDKLVVTYSLPLAVIGLVFAAYHNLLYYDSMLSYGIIPQSVASCGEGISCTSETIAWFGFVTIPFLSLLAFGFIVGCLWWYKKITKN